jgi:hypothetical protein
MASDFMAPVMNYQQPQRHQPQDYTGLLFQIGSALERREQYNAALIHDFKQQFSGFNSPFPEDQKAMDAMVAAANFNGIAKKMVDDPTGYLRSTEVTRDLAAASAAIDPVLIGRMNESKKAYDRGNALMDSFQSKGVYNPNVHTHNMGHSTSRDGVYRLDLFPPWQDPEELFNAYTKNHPNILREDLQFTADGSPWAVMTNSSLIDKTIEDAIANKDNRYMQMYKQDYMANHPGATEADFVKYIRNRANVGAASNHDIHVEKMFSLAKGKSGSGDDESGKMPYGTHLSVQDANSITAFENAVKRVMSKDDRKVFDKLEKDLADKNIILNGGIMPTEEGEKDYTAQVEEYAELMAKYAPQVNMRDAFVNEYPEVVKRYLNPTTVYRGGKEMPKVFDYEIGANKGGKEDTKQFYDVRFAPQDIFITDKNGAMFDIGDNEFISMMDKDAYNNYGLLKSADAVKYAEELARFKEEHGMSMPAFIYQKAISKLASNPLRTNIEENKYINQLGSDGKRERIIHGANVIFMNPDNNNEMEKAISEAASEVGDNYPRIANLARNSSKFARKMKEKLRDSGVASDEYVKHIYDATLDDKSEDRKDLYNSGLIRHRNDDFYRIPIGIRIHPEKYTLAALENQALLRHEGVDARNKGNALALSSVHGMNSDEIAQQISENDAAIELMEKIKAFYPNITFEQSLEAIRKGRNGTGQ